MTLLLVALLLTSAVPPSPSVIAEVVLVLPEEDAARLRQYVDIHPGDPLDPEAIRRTLTTLYGTGEFADIAAWTETTPNGLRLVLRPEPVSRLAAVRTVGAPGFSGRDARRAARLVNGEPLWEGRLDRACQQIAVALEAQGYLEARVTATTQALERGSEVVFDIEPGPRARVRTIHISGVEGPQRAMVAGTIRPRAGQWFSRERLARSLDDARSRLWGAGFAQATVETREAYVPDSGLIDLYVDVTSGPRLKVVFRGKAPPPDQQEEIRRSLLDAGASPDSIADAADTIEAAFRRLGHQDVRVSVRDEDGGATLAFEARVGPIMHVASVHMEGSPPIDDHAPLRTRAGRALDQEALDADVDAIRTTLRDRGYPSPDVHVDLVSAGSGVGVVFRVRSGERRMVGTVRTRVVPEGTPIVARTGLVPGAPFQIDDLAAARATLLAEARNAGYPSAEVTLETKEDPEGGLVDIDVTVHAGPRAVIDHVLVTGLVHTREEVVRRELSIAEGEPLRWDQVLESHRRLATLGLFRGVRIAELNPEDRDHHTLVVALEEAPRTTVTYGLGAAGIGAGGNPVLRASGDVTRRNLGGGDRTLSLFARLSFRGSRLLATYREPYVLGRRADLSFLTYREDEERSAFSYDRVGVAIQTTRTLSPERSLVLRYAFTRTRLNDLTVPPDEVDRQYRNSRTAGPSFSLFLDHRDDPLDPHRGRFLGGDLQVSDETLGGASFIKGFVQASTFQPLGPRVLVALGTRVGAAWPFRGEGLDLPERFFAGGHYSMRGFATDAVLPLGGEALLTASLELRLGLMGRLSLAAFSDAGNVFATASELALDDLRYTAGLGLRYRTPVGPIRLDWAHKLDRREGESAGRFHITVGHAF